MAIHDYTLKVRMDSDYDDPEAFNVDLFHAIESQEDVGINIGGNTYSVWVNDYEVEVDQ